MANLKKKSKRRRLKKKGSTIEQDASGKIVMSFSDKAELEKHMMDTSGNMEDSLVSESSEKKRQTTDRKQLRHLLNTLRDKKRALNPKDKRKRKAVLAEIKTVQGLMKALDEVGPSLVEKDAFLSLAQSMSMEPTSLVQLQPGLSISKETGDLVGV